MRVRRLNLHVVMIAAVFLAFLLGAYSVTRYRHRRAKAAQFASKAVEADDIATQLERDGQPVGGRAMRDAAEQCRKTAESLRSGW